MIEIPQGFSFYTSHVGSKSTDDDDFALLFSHKKASAAGVFTQNHFCGENIQICRDTLKNNELQAIFVSSGIANVATGEKGREAVENILDEFAKRSGISKDLLLMGSTGKIGPQLPLKQILKEFKKVEYQKQLACEIGNCRNCATSFANSIKTTDLQTKIRSVELNSESGQKVTITGMCKGSGMIEPNMATMLAYFVTDAKINEDDIDKVLKTAVNLSFNAISVDTDTSTSDMVVLMANGASDVTISDGEISSNNFISLVDFQTAFNQISLELAKDIVKDGEGASKLVTASVDGAKTNQDAKKVAKSIVNSPLVKSAIYGEDPNWGRIIMAVGKVFDVPFRKDELVIKFGDLTIFENNHEITKNIPKIEKYLANDEVEIKVSLAKDLINNQGKFSAYGCDLTEGYVDINANYTT